MSSGEKMTVFTTRPGYQPLDSWQLPDDSSNLAWINDGFPHQNRCCPCGVYFVFRRSDHGIITHDIVHRALT